MKKLLIILSAFCLYACADSETSSPEQKIRKTLSTIEDGIENRSLSQVIDNISDDYSDHQGRVKKDIKRLTQFQILKNQNIHLFTRIKSIEVNDGYASIELSSAMTSLNIDLSIEANRIKANSYKTSLVLKNESGDWRVISSSWQRGW